MAKDATLNMKIDATLKAAAEKAAADERASAKAEPALAHPIKALRPISRYMTTKAVTCTKS